MLNSFKQPFSKTHNVFELSFIFVCLNLRKLQISYFYVIFLYETIFWVLNILITLHFVLLGLVHLLVEKYFSYFNNYLVIKSNVTKQGSLNSI